MQGFASVSTLALGSVRPRALESCCPELPLPGTELGALRPGIINVQKLYLSSRPSKASYLKEPSFSGPCPGVSLVFQQRHPDDESVLLRFPLYG